MAEKRKMSQAPSGRMVPAPEMPEVAKRQRPDPTFDATPGGGRMSGEFKDETAGAQEFEFVQGPGGMLIKVPKRR